MPSGSPVPALPATPVAITADQMVDFPTRVAAGTSVVTVLLNPDRYYDVIHRGVTTAGAAATGDVFFAVNGGVPTAAFTAARGVGTIHFGDAPIPIGPRVRSIKMITAADAPVVEFFPSGTVDQ